MSHRVERIEGRLYGAEPAGRQMYDIDGDTVVPDGKLSECWRFTPLASCDTCGGDGVIDGFDPDGIEMSGDCPYCGGDGAERCGECEGKDWHHGYTGADGEPNPIVSCASPGCWHGWKRHKCFRCDGTNRDGALCSCVVCGGAMFAPAVTMTDREARELGSGALAYRTYDGKFAPGGSKQLRDDLAAWVLENG